MTVLESWLGIATRGLSDESKAKVHAEIEEHYASAIMSGVTEEEAVAALGNATSANRQYRKVLLTTGEARMIRLMKGEIPPGLTVRRVTAGKWLARILFAEAVGGILVVMMKDSGWRYFGATTVVLAVLQSVLPLQTVGRARVYRWIKWVALLVGSIPLFETHGWAPVGALVVFLYGDYRRMILRHKLPIEQWPKKLYV